jgi:two-component system, NarL family, response regulator LiaR
VNGAPIRVLLVEDNETFRKTLELLFALREEVEVVGSIATGDEAPAACVALRPDVVLMDYRMPGMNGAEATKAVLESFPETSVICLTASVTGAEVEELLRAGATSCVMKDQDLDVLVAAVREAAAS